LPRGDIGRICIITTGRSGSELLVDLVDHHPRMRCEGEILANLTSDPVRYVRGRASLARLRNLDAYGFKFNILNQHLRVRIDLREFIRRLTGDGFSFVHLRRANLLRQAVSSMRATVADDRFHRRFETNSPAIHIDVIGLITLMRRMETYEEHLVRCLGGSASLSLVYEDDLEPEDARQASVARVLALVGLEPVGASSTLRRTTPRALSDAVSNHDEIREVLSRTRYEIGRAHV